MKFRKIYDKIFQSHMMRKILWYVLAWCICCMFFRNIIMPSRINGCSMEPTLMSNDFVFVNRLAYLLNDAKRGDIIFYWSRELESVLAKRVIGIAGDTVELIDGSVYINGVLLDESAYLPEDILTYEGIIIKETSEGTIYDLGASTFIVPENTVFVMGDNRWYSLDSRAFEQPYISLEDIKGKYLFKVPNYLNRTLW